MLPSERRAVFGVFSVGAVLLSAAGLAYLGAVSYQADRGLVATAVDAQRRIAAHTVAALDQRVRDALEMAVETLAAGDGPPGEEALGELQRRSPLAAKPFRIGPRGELWLPNLVTFSRATDPVLDLLERRQRPTGARAVQLYQARQAERGSCSAESSECVASPADLSRARRLYNRLVKADDTAPEALLGLARVEKLAANQTAAAAALVALSERFGQQRDSDGVSYLLWADLGRSWLETEGSAERLLETLEGIVGRRYAAPEAFLIEAVADLRQRLAAAELDPTQQARLTRTTNRLTTTRGSSLLYGDLSTVIRSATSAPRGLGGARLERTLVFRRVAQRDIVGIELETSMFDAELAAIARSEDLAPGTRLAIHPIGRRASTEEPNRTLASASFGELLPSLAVSLVQPVRFPDPLDEIVRLRSRRHLLFSGALGLILVFGLLATARGTARVRELAKLKSDFVSTVSHELKTPLTSIRMFGEMLQQGVAGSDREREKHYQDIIVKESERLGLLIANLLDYSQIERGARRYSLRTLDARDVAREAVETFLRLSDGEGRDVELELGDGPGAGYRVRADREVLVQSLLNLLGNAAKYSEKTTPIEMAVRSSRDAVAIALTDHGPGIPEAEHPRIFREFYRSPAAQRSGVEGTGLGLALVKRHAQALGGDVSVQSAVGQGATFTVTLPRADAHPTATSPEPPDHEEVSDHESEE